MSGHTPGPWRLLGDVYDGIPIEINAANGQYVAQIEAIGEEQEHVDREEAAANAARIVACVNACEGIADPARLRAQRDDLLAACEGIIEIAIRAAGGDYCPACGKSPNNHRRTCGIDAARAAIAEARKP